MQEELDDIQLREVTFILQTITHCCFIVHFLYLLQYVISKKTTITKSPWIQKIQDTYYHVDRAMQLFNFGYILDDDEVVEVDEDLNKPSSDTGKSTKEEVKYELKYLEEYRLLKKEFKYNWERYDMKQKKIEIIRNHKRKQILDEVSQINKDMVSKCLQYLEVDLQENETLKIETEAEILSMRQQIATLEKKLSSQELEDEIKEEAHQQVVNEYLENLKNSFIIEKTPLGNVLMYYSHKKQSFEYYSDNTIPYRYLETVSRKYVKTYDCAYLYVDMEFEIQEAERKLKEAELKKQQQEEEEDKAMKETLEKQVTPTKEENKPKKDVFAKFKSYNKEAISGRVNTGAPPKNSIPNNPVTNKTNNTPILLKENANRYTCEGKMCNFSFLKKPDRKVVDKKYALSFADFKKMRQENKT